MIAPRFFLLLFCVASMPSSHAQLPCDCLPNFDAVVQKIQSNYAGFMDKTDGTKRAPYTRTHDSLRTVAARTSSAGCFDVLAAYTLFFRDKHIGLGNYEVSRLPKTYEKLTLEQARQRTRSTSPDDLPGIWRSTGGSVQVAILHEPGRSRDGFDYRGIVLSSRDTSIRPGLELFRAQRRGPSYFVKAILGGLQNHQHPRKQHGNIFYAAWNLTLVREFPHTPTPAERDELAKLRVHNGFHVRQLGPDVALISLRRGFTLSNTVMDSVLHAHEPLLGQTPNLIIDLRDNGGGNNSWETLLPYVYAKPVEWPGGWRVRASPDNIRMIAEDTVGASREQRAKDHAFLERLNGNMGQLVSDGGETITIKLDSVRRNPRRVVVVVNDVCASSSEFLIQIAKQSPGVTVMGSPTAGMMDYGDLRRSVKLPCPDLHLVIPMAKSPWTDTAPIDPTGILPHISLAHLPEAQWLDVVVKKLQSGTLPAKPQLAR